jgi:hypothetical protein
MVNYEAIQDRKNPNVLGKFTVLGTYDFKKGSRNQYEIKLYKPNTEKGSFYCTCPDHKFNSSKRGTVCKHITFLVCQVAKVMTRHFFETKFLTEKQTNDLIAKVSKGSDIWKDKLICREVKTLNLASFHDNRKAKDEEDVCPICYDAYGDLELLSCPKCTNYVHEECMQVWMEKRKKCVYCSDTIWEYYDRVKNGETIAIS